MDPPGSAAVAPGWRGQVDWGRLVMVPLCVFMALVAVARLVSLAGEAEPQAWSVLASVLTALLSGAFYALIVWAYLRRSPAQATSRVHLAAGAGVLATLLPFSLPFAGSGGGSTAIVLLGNLLLVAGFVFSVWSLRCLDRSLSVVPQARALVDRGPYAHVRHPLYLGELLAMLGLALTLGGVGPLAVWAVLVALQAYRAGQEETLLRAALAGYSSYCTRTWRIVPGLL